MKRLFLKSIFMKRAWQIMLFTMCVTPFSHAAIEIQEDSNNFQITSGDYQWTISKNTFDVINTAKKAGATMLQGGQASLQFEGNTITFGSPSEFLSGNDWVELRGWASAEKRLWYVARYKFWDGKPYTHLALSFTDRHDQPHTENSRAAAWERLISNFKIEVNTTQTLPTQRYEQRNAYHGGLMTEPEMHIVEYDNVGGNYQWVRYVDDSRPELSERMVIKHKVSGNGTNQVIWKPKFSGEATLEAHFLTERIGFTASGITYEIHHANGIDEFVLTGTQRGSSPVVNLGTYMLNQNSQVLLKDTGNFGTIVYAESLHVLPTEAGIEPVIVTPRRIDDDKVLSSIAPYSFVVQDFWQRFPIASYSSNNTIGVEAILEPVYLIGGMGMTLDMAIGIDGSNAEALALLDTPPERTLPDWWHAVDGTLESNAEYDGLVAMTADIIRRTDDRFVNYGWKNWGDYQINQSNAYGEGTPDYYKSEDWGSLQYDLATGLMMAYLRTGDPELWHRAKAAVRHMMDIDFVKFMPFADKRAMTLYRKGECALAKSHTCQEPNTAFGYAWRGFLLYYHLTGEEWAKELAHMSIDHGAFYTGDWALDWLMDGTSGYGPHRATAWALRAVFYGAKLFPNGTKYFNQYTRENMPVGTSYQDIADRVIDRVIESAALKDGVFSGMQPVWSAQNIESLAVYHSTATGDRKTALENIILKTADYFMKDAYRVAGDGTVELYYDLSDADRGDPEDWREGDIYTWLWLSTFGMAYQVAAPENKQAYADFAMGLFDYASHRYTATGRYHAPRPWSGVLAFPGAFVENLLNRDDQAPMTPANFSATQM